MNPITACLVLAVSFFTAAFASATDTLTVLHKFAGGNDGNEPDSLILASDGNFYGTTYLGHGTVFQVTPSGQFTTLFRLPSSVYNPNDFFYGDFFTGVVEGPDGFLYVSVRGSDNDPNPMLFRISKSGTDFQVVLQEAPYNLSVASDGNFYGADGNGIFRLSTSGTYTLLSSGGGMVVTGFGKQATNGNFYGFCYPAGVYTQHVCQVTTSGQVTPIYAFGTGANYRSPVFLTLGTDGFLYGVDLENPNSSPIQKIFQLSTSGSYTEIYQGSYCSPKTGCGRVLQASDGNLWITDPYKESVYSITTSGTLLQTVSFSSQPPADAHPNILAQAPSGILIGTTGEPCPCYNDLGSVFSLDAGLPPPR